MASVASTPSRLEREQREESAENEDAKHAAKRERVDATAVGNWTCSNWVRAAYFGLFDDDDDEEDEDEDDQDDDREDNGDDARWPHRAVPRAPQVAGRWVDVTALVCRAETGRATSLSQPWASRDSRGEPNLPRPGAWQKQADPHCDEPRRQHRPGALPLRASSTAGRGARRSLPCPRVGLVEP